MGIDIDRFNVEGLDRWSLPALESGLAAGVFPLFVQVDRVLRHVGTAFMIGGTGWIVTARHCVDAILRESGLSAEQLGAFGDATVPSHPVCIVHAVARHAGSDEFSMSLWYVEHWQMTSLSDLAFGSLHTVGTPPPVLKGVLSFALPGRGSRLRAIGYPLKQVPDLHVDQAKQHAFDWNTYRPEITIAAGTSDVCFAHRLARGYCEGPCLLTTCKTAHGMSGGPVINEAGNVCGIVTGSYGEQAVVSLLYPLLAMPLPLIVRPAPQMSVRRMAPAAEWIARGLIVTDGSEKFHSVVQTEQGIRVDPPVPTEWRDHCFEDHAAYERGIPVKTFTIEL